MKKENCGGKNCGWIGDECTCNLGYEEKEKWIKEFEKIWITPNEFVGSEKEPIFNLDIREKEIKSFIKSQKEQSYKQGYEKCQEEFIKEQKKQREK